MARRLLVVAESVPAREGLAARLPELRAGDVEVKVVAPASRLSFGQWLANEEDGARAEAAQAAEEAAGAVAGEAQAVEAEVGDSDPVQAAQDALRTFAADEIVVVLPEEREGREPSWLERTTAADFDRLGLPVRFLTGHAPRR